MRVEPYLFFEGRCEEAAEYYVKTLGAEVTFLMRYQDNPGPTPPGTIPPGSENKIMHMNLQIGETQLMASDGNCQGKTDFQGFALTLDASDKAEAERWFSALADGGHVRMPMGKTFFSPAFGMVVDRFGVLWMVLTAPENKG